MLSTISLPRPFAATLNGKRPDTPLVTCEQIVAGGELAFVMGPKPSR
jgi:hypothetical protein